MSYSSCIRQPENDRYIQIHQWQISFCQSNRCAALLLAFFTAWHDWKSKNDHYYRRANDIAEMHGDGRPHNEKAYLFFSMEELIEGCMGFYGKNAINQALDLLISLKVISVHKNPNPRYHFDKTKYFQFYPLICNRWIAENDSIENSDSSIHSQPDDSSDTPKQDDRLDKKGRRSAEMGQPSHEMGKAITDTTSNTTNKIHSINAGGGFVEKENQKLELPSTADWGSTEIQAVMNALTAKGFPAERFQYPDTAEAILHLLAKGATVEHFDQAYELAEQATHRQGKGFGVRYLAKVVLTLLESAKSTQKNHRRQTSSSPPQPPPEVRQYHYENDFSKGLHWMGDLLDDEDRDEFTAKS